MNLTFLSRYVRSAIASGFGVAFLIAAPRFAQAAHDAPHGAEGTSSTSILEVVNGIPAVAFSIAGTGLLIWAAVYAVYVSRSSTSRY